MAPRISIHWKSFLQAAAPLAALAGFFIAIFPPVGWLLFFPASIIVSLHLYRRRWSENLRAGHGARMGAAVSLLVFVFSSLIFVLGETRDPAAYRQAVSEAVKTLQQMEARNPEGPRISQVLAGPHGMLLFTCFSLVSLLIFLLVIGSATGAFYVILSRRTPRS